MARIIKQRTRFFLGAEGEGEQSFIKWLQQVADQKGLHIHIDCHPLGGGGYKTMLERAVFYRNRGKSRGNYKKSFLLVDEDRATSGIDWPINQLRAEADAQNITLCLQKPSHEGLLFRMTPGNERTVVRTASSALSQLRTVWPTYEKPADALTLGRKFSFDDLQRAAEHDIDLSLLLKQTGILG